MHVENYPKSVILVIEIDFDCVLFFLSIFFFFFYEIHVENRFKTKKKVRGICSVNSLIRFLTAETGNSIHPPEPLFFFFLDFPILYGGCSSVKPKRSLYFLAMAPIFTDGISLI